VAKRLFVVITLLITVSWVVDVSAVAAKAKKPKRADLTVEPIGVKGRVYVFNGDRPDSRSTFRVAVINRGGVRAGPSIVRFSLVHPRKGGIPLGTMAVPGVRAKRTVIGEASTPKIDEVAGAYRIRACADYKRDVRESNESNNCEFFDLPDRYFVVNRLYRGTFSGTVPLNPPFTDATERWQATNAVFTFQRLANGVANYGLTATVAYQDGGTSNGCTYSGASVDGNPTGFMEIHFKEETYTANGVTFITYPIFNECAPGGSEMGPRVSSFLDVGTVNALQTLPFSNTLAEAVSVNDINYTWNLRGARR
jgi:hypothetical protein